jgi:serine/threonine protein phosphatase PrpC
MTLALQVGYADRCFQDLPPCGDGMTSLERDHTLRLLLADGIGHGPHAHRVVNQLSEHFHWICGRSSSLIGMAECMRELHDLLRGNPQTDQAAVAMLEVHRETGVIAVLSVGNVRVHSVAQAGCFSFPCLNGMVGGHLPRQLPVTLRQAQKPCLLLLHSDGLSSRAVLPYLEQLFSTLGATPRAAQPMADALLRHCAKGSDDAACAVVALQEARS